MAKPDQRLACRLILIVVVADSLAATVLALAGRPPLSLGIGLLFGSAIGGGIILSVMAPELWGWWRRSRRPTGGRIWSRHFQLMLLSRCDWPLFILSAYWIGTAGTAVIWGIKPIMSIIFLRRLVHGNDGRRYYQPLSRTAWAWLALAGIGVVLVVISRPDQTQIAASWSIAVLGGLAGIASAICAGLGASRFEWGFRLLRPLPASQQQRLELPLIMGSIALVGAPVGLILLLAHRLGGSWPVWGDIWPGLLVGVILTAAGWSLATAAWLRTRRLGVGGLFYLTPPLTVAMLLLVGQLGTINPWLFGLGGLLILGSGLALVRADRQNPPVDKLNRPTQ